MDNNDAIKELNDIRSIMERSTRFQSINGWGILAVGIMALAAAWIADGLFNGGTNGFFTTIYGNTSLLWAHKTQVAILGSLVLVVVCGLTVLLSSMQMARRRKTPFRFDTPMRRTLINFTIPMLAGGLLCLALVLQGHYGLTSSIMLIFYGLALVNCHHFTLPMLGWLGYAELALGLADCFVASHALLFWAIGFGLLHIILGICIVTKGRRV